MKKCRYINPYLIAQSFKIRQLIYNNNQLVLRLSEGGDIIGRVIIMELEEQDSKAFEDFLAFLKSHPEIEKLELDKEAMISLPGFEIHLSTRKVFRNQQEIPLTKTEYEILLCLLHNANRVLTHSQIYEKVWRELDYGEAQKLVSHHVQAIRRKLNFGKDSCVRLRCIRDVGYCLER